MSSQTLRIIISIVLIVHGIGQLMGTLPALGLINTENWHARSWLLTPALGAPAARIISIALWVTAFAGFVAAGAGAFGWPVTSGSWRTIAVVASIISLVTLALYWNAFAVLIPNKVGSIAVNVAAIVAILGLDWPSPDVIA